MRNLPLLPMGCDYYYYLKDLNSTVAKRGSVFIALMTPEALFFLILGLRIFFQNIKVGGGKKIKIKITKKNFFI